MTSVTQQIPNYVGGISQQPDELKVPGQVRTAKNVLPDVTHGLLKRPGGRLIGGNLGAFDTADSKWFHYYRDENEQYIGQIQLSDGDLKMWRCDTGALTTIRYKPLDWVTGKKYNVGDEVTANNKIYKNLTDTDTASSGTAPSHGSGTAVVGPHTWEYVTTTALREEALKNYLKTGLDANGDEDLTNNKIHKPAHLQTLTLNDFTYVTNRNKTVEMAATVEPVRPPEAYIALKKVAYANQYSVNLFDDTTTETVTTATRIKVHSSKLDTDSSCPNTATEIFKVGSGDDFNLEQIQTFKFSKLDHGHNDEISFFETDNTAQNTKLTYCPPPWTTGTYYAIGDLVTGKTDNSKIYKATTAGTSTGSTAPSHNTGDVTTGGHTWTALTTNTYTANTADSNETDLPAQLYDGNACIQIESGAMTVASSANLTTMTNAWEAHSQYANLPFEFTSRTWGTSTAELQFSWKISGDYSDQISRIILHRGSGQTGRKHTIGGNNVVSAVDSALKTTEGQLDIIEYGWSTAANTLGAGRSDLFFRLTNTGQAVPDSTGDNYTCRYTTTVDILHGGSGWQVGDQIRVSMKDGSHVIQVEEISTSQVQANLGLIRPSPTSFDTKTTVTAESILGDLQSGIVNAKKANADKSLPRTVASSWENATTDGSENTTVQIIGNGIYIKRPTDAFNISSPSGDLLNVLTDSIKDIADLPNQCKHGYVVKVANSEAEEDDYYVKFFGHNDRDGEGIWEECAKPGTQIAYDPATMPIQIARRALNTFVVEPITWENALVGDTDASYGTNPRASFVDQTINKMIFFRNRLVMLSDENVIMSQPGEFFNFWSKSAITYTATDVIDISCSSEYPAIVYDGLQVNAGLILFTKNQQFMLTTDSDVLSPITAKINALSSYNFNFNTNPVSLGTTTAFLDNAGKYTRFFEMQSVLREGEVTVLEQSKNISKAFDKNVNIIANSRENSTIFFTVRGTSKLYGFRYYTTGEQRLQQAWFEWELGGEIQHIAMLDDALYAVIKNSTTYTMQKFSIKLDDNSHTIVEDATYRVHLDNAKSFAHTNLTYVSNGHYTKFDHTAADFNSSRQLYAVAVSTGSDKDFNGLLTPVTTFDDNGTTKVKIPGNWTTSDSDKAFNVVLGYDFDMEVEFPTIYIQQQEGERFRSDIQASLVLQRTKFSLGPSGVYKVTLKRIGKPDYSEVFESVKADTYTANTAGIDGEQVVNIPIYEKNTNLTLLLNSQHPSPATLYSMNWEGNYSDRYYKRV